MCLCLQNVNLGVNLTAESDSGEVGSWTRSFCSCIQGSETSNGGRERARTHRQEGGDLGSDQNENDNRHLGGTFIF